MLHSTNYLRIEPSKQGKPNLILVELKNEKNDLKKYRLYFETEFCSTRYYDILTTLPDLESVFNFILKKYKLYPSPDEKRRCRDPEKLTPPLPLAEIFNYIAPVPSSSSVSMNTAGVSLLGSDDLRIITLSDSSTSNVQIEVLPEETTGAGPNPNSSSSPLSLQSDQSLGDKITVGGSLDKEEKAPNSHTEVDPDIISVEKFDEIISQYVSHSCLRYFFPYRSETIRNLRELTSFDVGLIQVNDLANIDEELKKYPNSDNQPLLVRSKNKMYLNTPQQELIEISVDLSVIKKLPFSLNTMVNYASAKFPPALAKWFSQNRYNFCKKSSLAKDTIKAAIKSEHRLKLFDSGKETLKNNTDRRIKALNNYFSSRRSGL